jgi:RNA polymerase sigma-70 factor (ECF subfamily)
MRDGQWIRDAQVRFERPLLAYAARLMGDVERGRDLVQDAFARLCEQPPASVSLPQWLFTVCRNRALDLKRKEKHVTQVESLPDVATDDDPSRKLSQQEESRRVVRLIDTLSENQREVIRLKFQSGMTYQQIAEITGHSVSNVGFLIHTGLKILREKLS